MTQQLHKADVLGDHLITTGQEIKAMLADGRIDPAEAERLAEIAMDTLRAGVDAYDIAADIKNASHMLRAGRQAGQTSHLRALDEDIEARRNELDHRTYGDDTSAARRGLVGWGEKEAA